MDKILDLANLQPDRPKVKFRDGKTYEMRTLEDFSIQDRARIKKLQNTLGELATTDNPNEADIQRIEDTVKELLGMFLIGIPAGLIEQTSERDKVAILDFFIKICLPTGTERNQTGEKSLPDSNTATGGIPQTG